MDPVPGQGSNVEDRPALGGTKENEGGVQDQVLVENDGSEMQGVPFFGLIDRGLDGGIPDVRPRIEYG